MDVLLKAKYFGARIVYINRVWVLKICRKTFTSFLFLYLLYLAIKKNWRMWVHLGFNIDEWIYSTTGPCHILLLIDSFGYSAL